MHAAIHKLLVPVINNGNTSRKQLLLNCLYFRRFERHVANKKIAKYTAFKKLKNLTF